MSERVEGVASAELRAWLAVREPAIPEPLLARLQGEAAPAGKRQEAMESLLGAAREALADALAEEGERRGAFRLLAADAYVTYACEVALESHDPTSELLRTLDQVVAGSEEE